MSNCLFSERIVSDWLRHTQTWSERMKMICQINGIWKQEGVVTFISDKLEFKTQFVRNDKEVHYIFIS
jgi:hypothetical protein